MRVVQNEQMTIGEVDIASIRFNSKSRDDIPKILRGLQFVYTNVALRTAIFELLESQLAPKVSKAVGRPGMTLWTILVCGVIRLDLNCDYDRLHELVNEHNTLRQMLGHGAFEDVGYHFQTLKDNVSLLTPELLDQINGLVVHAGHVLVKKKAGEALRGRCDSFVVETNVHYPTDINLLLDAMRKVITLTAQWCEDLGMSDWRQWAYNLRQVKRLMRTAQNKKRSKASSPERVQKNEALIIQAHQEFLDIAQGYLDKAAQTLALMDKRGVTGSADLAKSLEKKQEIEGFMAHAVRQIEQTRRRVILGEVIPHGEKVFSIFEPHTEWISKGKAGVPMELGVKVCILEDQHQFILYHQVMQNQTDDSVTLEMVAQARQRFANLNACSFDKGFHSPANQSALKEQLKQVVLPRKGKLSQQARQEEQAPEFVKARRAHSAVESAINALEVHGLDACPDHGIDGFKRYVALAVLARNIHRIGAIVWQQDIEREQRKTRYADQGTPYRLAA
jgi:IS5 family transposase